MERGYKNINQILEKDLDIIYNFAFTITIPHNNKIIYENNKGHKTNRNYGTIPFKAQCHYLVKGIMPEAYYYFEQHADTRFHVHGYVTTTARKMLEFMKFKFEEIRCKKPDICNKLFLCEVVHAEPVWVQYCMKHQPEGLIFHNDIDKFMKSFLDNRKLYLEPPEVIDSDEDELNIASPDFSEYQFGKVKKPICTFYLDENEKWLKE